MRKTALALAAALIATAAQAQTPPAAPTESYPKLIPAPGGEVVIPNAGYQRAYDRMKFAPSRRAGDFLYISGVIVGPAGKADRSPEAFKGYARGAFRTLEANLKAEGLGFTDVVMINSFHVWDGPGFKGTRDEQFAAFSAVKDEFMTAPHPAWTAVGTTGLLADDGVVEVQMIAYAPKKP
jgi:enamine deaminase RidA (YjgF/YER057c/UK114 family)